MPSRTVDVCRFLATAGTTADFVVSAAVTGYQTPATANAVTGATYSYRAESADLTQWEVGSGAYTSSNVTVARSSVLFNSVGGTSVINFTLAPQVAFVALAEDLPSLVTANSYAGVQTVTNATASINKTTGAAIVTGGVGIGGDVSGNSFHPFAATSSQWGIDNAGVTVTIGPSSNSALAAGGGFIVLTDGTVSGQTGMYLMGGSAAALIATTGVRYVAPTITPAASTYSVNISSLGTEYRIYNGSSVSITFTVGLFRTRNTV